MNNLYFNQIKADIQSEVSQINDNYIHSITFILNNEHANDILDISVFLFVDEKSTLSYSKCINNFLIIPSGEEKKFTFNYISKNQNPLFHFRIIFRIKGESTHRYINFDYPKILSDNSQYAESFIALLKIKGLKEILNVFPITNGISFTNFGSLLDTFVDIYYCNYLNENHHYEICRSTLLKGINSLTLSNISYGEYSSIFYGNSILLEIPIIIDQA